MNDRQDSSRPASPKDRIIEATLALLAEKGLGALTMRSIAGGAEVSRQTLYNHYPDVESIVAEAIRRHNQDSIQMLETTMRAVDEPAAKLQQLVRLVVSIGAHAHHAAAVRHGLSAATRAALTDYDDALDRVVLDILEQGRARGEFRNDLAPDVDAALIRHMLNGLSELSAARPGEAPVLATKGTATILAAVTAG